MDINAKEPALGQMEDQPAGRRHADKRAAHLLEQHWQGRDLVLRLRLDPRLPWFRGHFPGAPCCRCGAGALGHALWPPVARPGGSFAGMNQLKFQRPLRPGQEVRVAPLLAGRQGPAAVQLPARETSMPAAVGCGYVLNPCLIIPVTTTRPLAGCSRNCTPGIALPADRRWQQAGAAAALDALAEEHGAWLTLLRHDRNLGKGAAVATGLMAARAWASATGCR